MRCAASDIHFLGEFVLGGDNRFVESMTEGAVCIAVGSAVKMFAGFSEQHDRRIK
jgi:hypothetical protein